MFFDGLDGTSRYKVPLPDMTQISENSKEPRVNISLTGDGAKLLRELHSHLKNKHTPVKVAITDVVSIALRLLQADLNK